MAVSIIACPSCKTLLLPETPQCPTCHHVLDESKGSLPRPTQAPRTGDSESENQVVCPSCRELVRRGLVRCWNCGSFMREDIAETYQRMQSSPTPVIYSEIDDERASSAVADGSQAFGGDERIGELSGDDIDFELSLDVQSDDTEPDRLEPADTPAENVESLKIKEPLASNGAGAAEKADSHQAEKPAAAGQAAAAERATDSSAEVRYEFENEFDNAFGELPTGSAGGDALMQVALAEEAEIAIRRRAAMNQRREGRAGFLVYCPNGHRIEVQERHRGLTGRCPKCREAFAVPKNPWDEESETEDDAAKIQAAAAAQARDAAALRDAEEVTEYSAGEYSRWMTDVHLHSVNVGKLKLTPGSLTKLFQDVDVAVSAEGLLLMSLAKPGGLFGGGDKKKESVRENVLTHLNEGKSLDDLPAAQHYYYKLDAIQEFCVVQPVVSENESMFAGVPVFGQGRIAVRLPKRDASGDRQFASFTLSEFRRFAAILHEQYGIERFGEDCGVPLTDEFTERHCHFSDQPLQVLEHLEYYENDPAIKLQLIGRKCQECGLVMSEESRENENFGGKNARSIAKSKCPGCGKRFGSRSLYSIAAKEAPAPTPEAAASS